MVPFPLSSGSTLSFFFGQLATRELQRHVDRFTDFRCINLKNSGEETSEAASVSQKLAKHSKRYVDHPMIMIILDIIWPLIFFSADGSFLRTCSILNLERTPLC